jgi:hypothetical protein
MRKLVGLSLVLSLAVMAHGQSAAAPDGLQGKLAKLSAASEDLEEHLPSFVCKETLVSQELRGKKVKTEVRAAGELRVMRDPTGKLNERFQASEMNGRPITPDKLRLPMFVSGGFKNALDFLRADLQTCFHFSVAGNRLDFDSGTDAATPECAKHTETRGFALLSSDGDIVHMERQVPVELAAQRNAVPFGSIDLNRTDLGGKSFLLSTHVRAEIPKGKSTYRWEANYSECRLYSVSVTIGPATPVDRDDHDSGAGVGPTNP